MQHNAQRMKNFNILNNALGWLMFAIAAATYLMTIEPTASFWDCGEFISQGYKLEVGHPPGNPIFMLAARFAINFSSDPSTVAMCVNSMSALLSAATILLLFWTITHLVRRLVAKDDTKSFSLVQMLVIFGSGIAGSLVYTWSDTFWFSAVEGEVYAFSSFCTALVFWLILKWENRAEEPHSDRYLILIAYVIGVSIAVHLLNLLCIPAIVLVFYYKKFNNTSVKGSLLALLVSFGIIVLILYGLVPGFIEMAQYIELYCVNVIGMPFNTGVLIYAIAVIGVFIWCLYELYRQKNPTAIKLSFFLSVFLSGMLFIGDGWFLPFVLIVALLLYLFRWCRRIPARIFSITVLSILVIFIGYSSYALILIRSSAQTPMDQNSPDNVFALASYLNREQYGDRPLFYGQTLNAPIVYQRQPGSDVLKPVTHRGKTLYAKEVKTSPDQPDRYKAIGYSESYEYSPEMKMLFPRIYSSAHATQYRDWVGLKGRQVEATTQIDEQGKPIRTETKVKPTMLENLRFFIDYQLNYMYWRYFMWNFVGRQNDIQGQGEITHGNWVSGISFIDNPRLGDQSLLPSELSTGNKGHNVFYFLPLLLGIIGLLWQAFTDKRGIEQFWVIFFLFFMTGIAIVIYLNQTPNQPRERDYSFAGSFYAFAIWVGMGVAGLWKTLIFLLSKKKNGHNVASKSSINDTDTNELINSKKSITVAIIACIIGLIVPLQMVSQTWDDHDRSGRYTTRDFGMNYLSSVDENGIIFTNGDNDTFPLWYCQEVEGYRTDVRVVNLSYLSTDWYIDQMRRPAYESASLPMMADASTFAYNSRQYGYFIYPDTMPVPVQVSLRQYYSNENKSNEWQLPEIKYPVMYIPVDSQAVVDAGVVSPKHAAAINESISCNMLADQYTAREMAMSSSKVMSLDIISSSINEGWKRPVYFAMTVPESYYLGLSPYLQCTGMAYQLTPIRSNNSSGAIAVNTDKMYDNVVNKFRWGGLDKDKDGHLYLDETVSRMVTTTRSTITDLALALIYEGKYDKAREVLDLMVEKLPEASAPYSIQIGQRIAQAYALIGEECQSEADTQKALDILDREIDRYAQYAIFCQSLDLNDYRRLSYNDQYIDQHYVMDLLDWYSVIATDEQTENKVKALEARGMNLTRQIQFRQRK